MLSTVFLTLLAFAEPETSSLFDDVISHVEDDYLWTEDIQARNAMIQAAERLETLLPWLLIDTTKDHLILRHGEGMEIGKRMGKYCLYVYMGIYILYMLPTYMLNLVEASMKYPGFPFNVFRFFFKILEKPIRKLAGPAKFELGVYWVPLPIMYLNILGGIPIRMLHKAVKLALTGIGKYMGLFKGFKCIRSTGHIINFIVDVQKILATFTSEIKI